jgi:hypothetical protein
MNMAVIIKGIANVRDRDKTIKNTQIKSIKARVPENNVYSAKATIDTIWGSIELTGMTLHDIIKDTLEDNQYFRDVLANYIKQINDEQGE